MQASQGSSVPSLKINYFRIGGTDVLMPAGNIQHSIVAWSERLATAAAEEGSSEPEIENFSAALSRIGNSWRDCALSQILPETNDVHPDVLVSDDDIRAIRDPKVLRELMTNISKKAREMERFAQELETAPDHQMPMALASVIGVISTALLNESDGRLQDIVDGLRDNVAKLKAASSTTPEGESDETSKLRELALALHIQDGDITVSGLELELARTRVDLMNTLLKSHEFRWTDVWGITSNVTESTKEAQMAKLSKRQDSYDAANKQFSRGEETFQEDCRTLRVRHDKLSRLPWSTLTNPSALNRWFLDSKQRTANRAQEVGTSLPSLTLPTFVRAPESHRSRPNRPVDTAVNNSARRARRSGGSTQPLIIDGVPLVPESQGTQDD